MKKLILILVCFLSLQATAQKIDSCAYYRRKVDTLNHRNFILQSQVDWVQYYLALMKRRPKDTIYSKGWLIRAVSSKLPPNKYEKPTVKKKK